MPLRDLASTYMVVKPSIGAQQPDCTAGLQTVFMRHMQAVSAAIGYMMLFLDLISTYMGGPLLHEGSYQGSTTVLWQQQSFWNGGLMFR